MTKVQESAEIQLADIKLDITDKPAEPEEESKPAEPEDESKSAEPQSKIGDSGDEIKTLVEKLYSNSRTIIEEFLEDGLVSGFKDIPMVVWYNVLSSLCALVMRMTDILGNEKLQEAVVYQTMLMILSNDIPLEKNQRNTAIAVYKRVAPTVIDVLIPGTDDCLYKACFCLPKLRRKRKHKTPSK